MGKFNNRSNERLRVTFFSTASRNIPQGVDVKNGLQRDKRCAEGGTGKAFRDIVLQEGR